MKEGNRKNKNVSSSPKRTRPVNLSGPSGSRHTRLSPPPSVSVLDGEIITEELGLLEISPKTNPRSFPYRVKQQCWEKAEKVKGRDPDRWRRDPLGNTIFRKLVGCPGCLCHDYDHIIPYSKDGYANLSKASLVWTHDENLINFLDKMNSPLSVKKKKRNSSFGYLDSFACSLTSFNQTCD